MRFVIRTMSGTTSAASATESETNRVCFHSWGTKGDSGVATDLGVVNKISKDEGEVEVELPTDPQDIENQYGAALMELERKVPPPEVSPSRKGGKSNSICI